MTVDFGKQGDVAISCLPARLTDSLLKCGSPEHIPPWRTSVGVTSMAALR